MINFSPQENHDLWVIDYDPAVRRDRLIKTSLYDLAAEYGRDETTTPNGVAPRMHARGSELWTWGTDGNNPKLVAEFDSENEVEQAITACEIHELSENPNTPLYDESLDRLIEAYIDGYESIDEAIEATDDPVLIEKLRAMKVRAS